MSISAHNNKTLNSLFKYEIPKENFIIFFHSIYNSLFSNNFSNEEKKETFVNLLNYPLFISEKIFNAITKNNNLNENIFINFFYTIFYGNDNNKINLLFEIFDINNENKLYKKNIEIFLYQFHLKKNYYKKENDLELINNIINNFFINEKEYLTKEEFIKIITNINCDIFYLFFIFLNLYFSFNKDQILFLSSKIENLNMNDIKIIELENNINNNNNNIIIKKNPSNDLFKYFKIYLNLNNFYFQENEKIEKEEESFDDDSALNELNVFEEDLKSLKNINNYEINPKLNMKKIFTFDKNNNNNNENYYNIKYELKRSKSFNLNYKYNIFIFKYDLKISNCKFNNEKENSYLYFIKNILFQCKYDANVDNIFIEKFYIINNIIDIIDNNNNFIIYYYNSNKSENLKIFFNDKNDKINLLKKIKFKKITDKYNLLFEIFRGKNSSIILGKSKDFNQEIVIKQIKKTSFNSNKWEIKINKLLKKIENKNIIKIFDVFSSLNYDFIVMEFIKENLYDYIKTNFNLSIEIIFHFLKEISNGLLILNKFGVIHREINLTNVLLKKNNEFNVKIIDFSFSKIIGTNELLNDFNIIISPEVLLKQPYDYKEDIWQFGLLGYYLLKRKYPFEIKNYNNLLNMNLSLNLNHYHKLKEIVVVNIINGCLFININKRIEIIDIHNLLI